HSDMGRRHPIDAGDRPEGGPRSGGGLAGPAARPALVRRHSRAPRVSTDILSGLAAYGAISAFALSRVKATACPRNHLPRQAFVIRGGPEYNRANTKAGYVQCAH